MLGVDFDGKDVIWQDYNPYPQIEGHMPKEWVFAEEGVPQGAEVFNQEDPITSRLQEVLLPYPGSFVGLNSSPLKFTPLIDVSGGEPASSRPIRSYLEQADFHGRGRG